MNKYYLSIIIFLIGFIAAADAIDRLDIIKADTGDMITMEVIENPDLVPGQEIAVLVHISGLEVKWNEGMVDYIYSYYSDQGHKILESKIYPVSKRTADKTWELTTVHRLRLPENISNGAYLLQFEVSDYHSRKIYTSYVEFTIGLSGSAQSDSRNTNPEKEVGQENRVSDLIEFQIEDTVISLESISKTSNRLTFRFKAVNSAEESYDLTIHPYDARIINDKGKEYLYLDTDGGGNMLKGVSIPPGVPMALDFYMNKPATNIDFIALLELNFYYTDDSIELKNISIPYP